MSASHQTVEREGKTLDILTDDESGARLMVARQGAEPVSLARRTPDGAWLGFLNRDAELGAAPDGGWSNHATVMGYYIHRIKGERTFYRGHEIRGGTHSFLRHKTFGPPAVRIDEDGASLSYEMTPGGYLPEEYPYRVRMRLTYLLAPDGALRVHFAFASQEPEISTHVGFGLHPGFAVDSLATCQVLLPAGRYRRLLAPGNFLSGEVQVIDHASGPMPFAKENLQDSYLLDLADVPERVFTVVDTDGGRRVEVDCQEAPYLTLWSSGPRFVCVEPCWGLPDRAEQTPFELKPGIQEIAPGGTLEREFSIRAELLA